MQYPIYVPHRDRKLRIDSAKTAINAILPLDLYPAHKRELLSVCIWKLTEADGKSKVRYWSQGALEDLNQKLHHEHVHERKELISRLLAGENVELVAAEAVACMVTPSEHRILTKCSALGWDRYREASIKVYDSAEGCWLID